MEDGRAVLRISFDELLDRSSPTVEVDDRTSYGAMRLTEVHDPARHPARIFFQDRSRPVLFYVGGDERFEGMGQETVQAELGEPEAKLACRAGKEYAQWVYPATGVAVAVSRDRLAFLEVFPPTTLEEYRRTLYQEPGPFVR